jgi:hypothetical protein
MLTYEPHIEKQFGGGYSYANAGSRGRGAPWTCGGSSNSGCGHGLVALAAVMVVANLGYTNTNFRRNLESSSDAAGQPRPRCRIYFKLGYTAATCWFIFDKEYVPDNRVVVMASSSDTDPNWFLDFVATDHITMHERYNCNDKIHLTQSLSHDGFSTEFY